MLVGLKDFWKKNRRNSLKWKLKNIRWEFRYAWRRAWYGFDDMDCIEMYDSFIERYKAILKEYRKYHQGSFNVPEEYRDVLNKHFFDWQETDIIIEMMIFHLEMMNEDNVEKVLYGKNVYDDDYVMAENMFERGVHINSIMNQNKEAFMRLFNLFFWDLWD